MTRNAEDLFEYYYLYPILYIYIHIMDIYIINIYINIIFI